MKRALTVIALAYTMTHSVNAQNTVEPPSITSDTLGYDFSRYMTALTNRVRENWYSVLPEIARLGRTGRVVVGFSIIRDGNIEDLRVLRGSETEALDQAATGAIRLSDPFAPLPSDFKGEHLTLMLTFLYNVKSDVGK